MEKKLSLPSSGGGSRGSRDYVALHARAVGIARRYLTSVVELIEILQEIEECRIYRYYDCTSVFQYAVTQLSLSEDCALTLIRIARKAKEVPELKERIGDGLITVSKARKICAVLTPENKNHWLELASSLPHRRVEQEVARVNPKEAVQERASFVAADRYRLELGVSEPCLQKFKRAQDLVSKKRQIAVDFEQTLEALVDFYLERQCPQLRAERSVGRKRAKRPRVASRNVARPVGHTPGVSGRRGVSQQTLHSVRLRDQGRCTHRDRNGKRCENTRWLEFHHKIPIAHGGDDSVENLTTLCRSHHQTLHLGPPGLDVPDPISA